MGTLVDSASAGAAAQQASGANLPRPTPEQLAPSTTQGVISVMTYNADAVERGRNGKPTQQGTMTFQNFSLPEDMKALKAELAHLEKGTGNPGDQVRVTSGEGEGWAQAKAPNNGGLDMIRQAIGAASPKPGTDTMGPKDQTRLAQPRPAPTSPLNVPK